MGVHIVHRYVSDPEHREYAPLTTQLVTIAGLETGALGGHELRSLSEVHDLFGSKNRENGLSMVERYGHELYRRH